jgi:hypothetical protein
VSALEHFHIFGTGTLGAVAFGEFDGLTFAEFVEGSPLDALAMEKQVLAVCDFDKAEAFVSQFLNRPFGHVSSYVIENEVARTLSATTIVHNDACRTPMNLAGIPHSTKEFLARIPKILKKFHRPRTGYPDVGSA